MYKEQYYKNLSVPQKPIDVVIDTDTFNEVDDQFAIAYLLASKDKLHLEALYAAPFSNHIFPSPKDGMERSYQEIHHILSLAEREDLKPYTYHGSKQYLANETTPVYSDAAMDLVTRAQAHTPENPLYVIAIAAITNVASALLINPDIAENIVVIWLGGHAQHLADSIGHAEFNMRQDIAAARVVFASGAPLVHLPCRGVASSFSVSYAELERFLKGKNKMCDYLTDTVKDALGEQADKHPCSRIIWDVTAVAWLLNDNNRFMASHLTPCPIPEYNNTYTLTQDPRQIQYVTYIYRDELAQDLFEKLANTF